MTTSCNLLVGINHNPRRENIRRRINVEADEYIAVKLSVLGIMDDVLVDMKIAELRVMKDSNDSNPGHIISQGQISSSKWSHMLEVFFSNSMFALVFKTVNLDTIYVIASDPIMLIQNNEFAEFRSMIEAVPN